MMPCIPFQTKDGLRGFARVSRPRRRKCSCCGTAWSTLECDYPTPSRKSGTCDKPLCGKCAVSVGPNLDYCPDHPAAAGAQAAMEV